MADSDDETYTIAGDTENHRQGEGYQRTMILVQWDKRDPRRMARIKVRVDRRPENSYARADVWVESTGWQEVTAIGPDKFWYNMPGYTRGQTTKADIAVLNLVDELVDALIETGI